MGVFFVGETEAEYNISMYLEVVRGRIVMSMKAEEFVTSQTKGPVVKGMWEPWCGMQGRDDHGLVDQIPIFIVIFMLVSQLPTIICWVLAHAISFEKLHFYSN